MRRYVTRLLGNGRLCPISEMIGRRRLRLIEAGSAEGKRLLRSGAVTLILQDGRRFSGVPVVELLDRLAEDASTQARDEELDPRASETLDELAGDLRQQSRDYS